MERVQFANILLAIIPLLLAITVHEAAHGYVAKWYGDPTAERLGRLTLNPLKHIDPIGTVLVPLFMFVTSSQLGAPMVFGWAKPIPVNLSNLRNVRIGNRMISIAGPLSNLLMAFIWAFLMLLHPFVPDSFEVPLNMMCLFGLSFNITLFVLNMLPTPPLDGGHFVETFLPAKQADQFRQIEPYGIWIILFLFVTGLLEIIMEPFYRFIYNFIMLLIN